VEGEQRERIAAGQIATEKSRERVGKRAQNLSRASNAWSPPGAGCGRKPVRAIYWPRYEGTWEWEVEGGIVGNDLHKKEQLKGSYLTRKE